MSAETFLLVIGNKCYFVEGFYKFFLRVELVTSKSYHRVVSPSQSQILRAAWLLRERVAVSAHL
jgi:hypothetical protein